MLTIVQNRDEAVLNLDRPVPTPVKFELRQSLFFMESDPGTLLVLCAQCLLSVWVGLVDAVLMEFSEMRHQVLTGRLVGKPEVHSCELSSWQ
jgi:hypothetical protein